MFVIVLCVVVETNSLPGVGSMRRNFFSHCKDFCGIILFFVPSIPEGLQRQINKVLQQLVRLLSKMIISGIFGWWEVRADG